MGDRHFIDELLFATDLDREAFECAPWDDWPGLCRDRLLAVIEKVFDEFSPEGDTVHRLDQLEVDLGELPDTAPVEEVEARLAEALRRQLEGLFLPGSLAGDARPAAVPKSVAALEQLEFYLEHGLLPWNADASGPYDLEKSLRQQAGRHGARLGPWLLKTDRALERAIRQLPDGALAQVLAALAPRGGEAAFAAWLARLQEQVAKTPRSETRYRTWRAAFRSALGKRGELRQAVAAHPERELGASQGAEALRTDGESSAAVRGGGKPTAAASGGRESDPLSAAGRPASEPAESPPLAAGIPAEQEGLPGREVGLPLGQGEPSPDHGGRLATPRRPEAALPDLGRATGTISSPANPVGLAAEAAATPSSSQPAEGPPVQSPLSDRPGSGARAGQASGKSFDIPGGQEAPAGRNARGREKVSPAPAGILAGRAEGGNPEPVPGSPGGFPAGQPPSPDCEGREGALRGQAVAASAVETVFPSTSVTPPVQGIPAAGKENTGIPMEAVPPAGHPPVDPHGYWVSGQSPAGAAEDEGCLRAQVLAQVQGVFAEAVLRHASRAAHPGRYYRRLLAALAEPEPVDLEALAAGSGNPAPAARPAGTAAEAASRTSNPGNGRKNSPALPAPAPGESAEPAGQPSSSSALGATGDAGTQGLSGNTAPAVESALPPTSSSAPDQGVLAAGKADSGIPKEAVPGAPPADAIQSPAGSPLVDSHGYWASGQSPEPGSESGAPPEGAMENEEELRAQVLARVEGVFAEAVLRHAARAVHPGRYYRRLLAALAEQEPVDLEALAAESGNPAPAVRPAGAAAKAASRTAVPGASPSVAVVGSSEEFSGASGKASTSDARLSVPGNGRKNSPPPSAPAPGESIQAAGQPSFPDSGEPPLSTPPPSAPGAMDDIGSLSAGTKGLAGNTAPAVESALPSTSTSTSAPAPAPAPVQNIPVAGKANPGIPKEPVLPAGHLSVDPHGYWASGQSPEPGSGSGAPREGAVEDEKELRTQVLARVEGVFAEAVLRHAARAVHPGRYYRRLLAALAGQAPVDLEALTVQSGNPAPTARPAGAAAKAASRTAIPGASPSVAVVGSSEEFSGVSGEPSTSAARLSVPGNDRKNFPPLSEPAPGESVQAAGQPSFPDSGKRHRAPGGQAVAARPEVTPRDIVPGPTGPIGRRPLAERLVAAASTGEPPLSTSSPSATGATGDAGSAPAGTEGFAGHTAPAVESALPSTSASLPVQGIPAADKADSGIPKEVAPGSSPADNILSPAGSSLVDPHGYWASGQSSEPGSGPGALPEGAAEDEEALRVQVLARVEGIFAEAVLRHAARAAHPGRYYRRLLAALAGQEPVDLEALAAGSGTPDSPPSSAARPAGTAADAASQTTIPGASPSAAAVGSSDGFSGASGEPPASDAHLSLPGNGRKNSPPLPAPVQGIPVAGKADSGIPKEAAPGVPPADTILSPAGSSLVDPHGYWASGQSSEPGSGAGAPPEGAAEDEEALRAQVLARVEGVFAEAVLRHAARAAHPGCYYRRLLAALAGQEPVDLEALAAGSGTPDSPSAAQPAGAVGEVNPGTPTAAPSAPGQAGIGTTAAGLPSRAWIEQSLAAGWNALGLVLAPLLAQPEQVARMAEAWPDDLLARLFAHLRGDDFVRLRPYADAITAACPRDGEATRRRQHWQYLAAVLFPAVRYSSAAPFVNGYADFLAASCSGGSGFRSDLCAHLPEGPEQRILSQHIRFWLLGSGPAPRPAAPPAAAEAARLLPGGGLSIANAGQVLAFPYLPRLFDMLGLLEKGRFAGEEAARRACHLLQFMVDAREEAPEYQLVLNKLLCGLDIRHPLEAGIQVSEVERSAIEGMLKAMIAHWGALGNTSIAGLRETFLQRQGALSFKDDAWQLKVERKTVDVLMDRLPWGFSIVRYAWMKQAVMVEWR